jgi:hypothetical protein
LAARFVDAVFVNDDPADKAAELDQPMPVAAIACQAGGLDRKDRPCEQDLCIAERHSGPWINLRRADEVADGILSVRKKAGIELLDGERKVRRKKGERCELFNCALRARQRRENRRLPNL